MARPQSRYVCQACAAVHVKWEGQCRTCGQWNTLVETVMREPAHKPGAGGPRAAAAGGPGGRVPQTLASLRESEPIRTPTGISEMDRVLGGGLVPGSVVLVGGEPGIGKSTLLLQAAGGLAGSGTAGGRDVLYATGEESAGQVRLRAGRLGLLDGPTGERIRVVAENEVGRICELAREARPAVLIVDSIQTVTTDDLEGPAGSVGQVRESALRLMELAKQEGIAVVVVGHVTKDGTLAGPKTLEHLVDAVLSLEGERTASMRLLRATKNRFGSTEEVGVFEMVERGLAEVADPGRAFLAAADEHAPGAVVGATLEGTRPLLVEVQGLVAPGSYGSPRRTASGFDGNRLSLLIAVLGRRAGIALGSHDVYANLAGGLDLADPGLDLPLALALASSLRDRVVRHDLIAIGEVGLLGELRPVPGLERRLREAARLGFKAAVVPRTRTPLPEIKGLRVDAVSNLREAIGVALAGAKEPPAEER
jgi:DNA repair protein RadA/Sms